MTMSKHHRTAVAAPPRVKGHPVAVTMPGAHSVVVTGSFCDWSREGHPLEYDRNGGVWGTVLMLPPGRYEYRLIVDGEWRDDPACARHVPNPFGGENCVFEV
jgi:1,4-alpha-glucan branching enzyme